MAEVTLTGVTKRYGDAVAVRGVDLTVADGEFVTLLGPSGCGKTTTLHMVAGLIPPTSGVITIGGRVVADVARGRFVPPNKRNLGMVFQSYALWPHMTLAENVGYPLKLRRVPPKARAARVRDVLSLVALDGLAERYPHELSGGQQQRVAIARAIVTTPSLILADEPTGNLDSYSSVEVMDIFQRLNAQLGITVMFVTHEPDIAEYTRRVLRIRDGYLGADEAVLEPRSAAAELAARTEVIPFPATV